MRDIQEMCEQMRKHRDIKQEFETEWSEVFSVAEGAKEKADKAIVPAREIEQLLLSLAEPFSKAFETQGASPDPKKIAAALGRRTGGFCRSCGFKLTVVAAFCNNCGAKVR